ncbi:MAG: TM2 domain-containing protein [Alphaproteobacteria bacterium]|nr:TM2 domain-containing protein [Alphaproteobacteria bacterium]
MRFGTVDVNEKSFRTYALLLVFLGAVGAHKFYLSKVAMGFLYLVITVFAVILHPLFIVLILMWVVDFSTGREQVREVNAARLDKAPPAEPV